MITDEEKKDLIDSTIKEMNKRYFLIERKKVAPVVLEKSSPASKRAFMDWISYHVCMNLGVNPEELALNNRKRETADARCIVYYLVRKYSEKAVTLHDVGYFTGRTHGAVMNGIKVVLDRMDTNKQFKATMAEIELDIETEIEKGKQILINKNKENENRTTDTGTQEHVS